MTEQKDTYKTIDLPAQGEFFKDRGSKFYGYTYPIFDESEVKPIIELLKKEHHTARHWCYAWQIGESYQNYRVNDDGEPSNSAGMPIFGQLQSYDVTNILVVVVRYFGGTKLGIGGLMQAYKTAAKMSLESSTIVQKTIDQNFLLQFEYPEMNIVMRVIKEEKLTILNQTMQLNCEFKIAVRKKNAGRIFDLFDKTHKVCIKKA